MKMNKHCLRPLLFLLLLSCDKIRNIEQNAYKINKYEQAALALAKKNRELKAKASRLAFEVNSLKSKNDNLAFRLKKKGSHQRPVGRSIASISSIPVPTNENDLVKFEIYRWSPEQMFATAEDAFKKRNYEKAAQFFHQFFIRFPTDERINDVFFFQAGVASFEAGGRQGLALDFLGRIIANYPRSEFYRGAKLWTALIYLKNGNRSQFVEVLEEFRKKYRNTEEWNILSHHYEKYIL